MISSKLKNIETLIENGFTVFAFSKNGIFSKDRSDLNRNSVAHSRMMHILNTPNVVKSIKETDTCIELEASQDAIPACHRSAFFPDGFYRFEVQE
ncbi:hypothetical protein [Photobacterium damselae]|uniref:hypothetical protein n=1 Tax=Photobacterium damselae TaxID=38293 RepID=UPI001F1C484F|nr:hypothetical protein [Photobacterium damselae]UKA04500.1 hypothetical protein IHC89_23035 [Photobacterium damselae subsp. damselae]